MKKNNNIVTLDFDQLRKSANNIYEATCIITKRSKQINSSLREIINYKVEEFVMAQDDIKEIFENQEQIKISKYYEKLPKPIKLALEELLEGKLDYRYKDTSDEVSYDL